MAFPSIKSSVTAGFVFALASAALFAIRPIFVKLVYAENVDPLTLIGLRMAFSAPIYGLLLILFLHQKRNRVPLNASLLGQIFVIGLTGYFLASYFDLIGLQYVSAQLGRMLLYTYPTFVVILGAIFYQQPITARTIIALLFTYAGVALIFNHDLNAIGEEVALGALWILASAFAFSFYLMHSKPLIAQIGSQVFTCIALIAASLGIFIYWGLTANPVQEVMAASPTALMIIGIIAVFCTVIPTFFTAAAVDRIGPDRTGIVAMVGPGFTSIFAVWILAEAFTWTHAAGIAVTILGVSFLKRR